MFFVFTVEPRTRAVPIFLSSPLAPHRAADYAARYIHVDPRVEHAMRAPAGAFGCDYEFIDEGGMDRHEYYDWLSSEGYGLRYYGGTRIVGPGGESQFASLQRTRLQGHPEREDAARMARVAPHAIAAMRLTRLLQEARGERRSLIETFDAVDAAVAIVERGGGVSHANAAARAEPALRLGGDSGCRLADPAADRRLAAALAAALSEPTPSAPPSFLAFRPDGALRRVRVTPLARQPGLPPQAAVVVEPVTAVGDRIAALADRHGLSHREADVAADIAAGRTLAEISAARGVSIETVRSQLKAAMAKLGVSRQVELVRLVGG